MKGYTFLNVALALLLLVSTCHADSEESDEVTLDPNPATIVYTAKPSSTARSSSNEDSSTETTTSTSEPTTEPTEEPYQESTDAATTESTISTSTDAPKVCSPIQILYEKIQNELEKIVTEISNFQREAMTKISQNEDHQQLLQLTPPPPPPAPATYAAAGAPARMNLIQLWNMVQQLQQAQQLAASQQLLQQVATISPPSVTQYATR